MTTHSLRPFTHVFILLLFSSVLLAACAPQSAATPASYSDKNSGGVAPAAQPAAPQESQPEMAASNGQRGAVSDTSAQDMQRIVIKNASLTIVVSNPAKSMATISTMAEEMGGYVVSANVYMEQLSNGNKAPRASITLRVPAEKLNDALSSIRQESSQDPLSENITSQDVTKDYIDLQSRLTNLQNEAAQLTKIMESATKTEDVMNVFTQLVQVQEQIEVIKGQIKYYDESAALSAISVELMANEAVQPLTIGGWQPVGVAKDAIQTLLNTLKFLANAAIWIVLLILPVLLVLYFIFFLPLRLLWRFLRKGRGREKKPAQPPAPDQPEQ
jgi:hypothetical protein